LIHRTLGSFLLEIYFSKIEHIKNNRKKFSFSKQETAACIGILDIFGFENLKLNTYEQLIVNSTNEQLQQSFYQNLFDNEHQLYQKEGIPYPPVAYKNNKQIIDLIMQKPIGLLSILKDESKTFDSDDRKCVDKFNDYFNHNDDFISSSNNKQNPPSFGLVHTHGKIKYNATKILDKFRDYFCKSLAECLQKSDDHFIADLFSTLPSPNGSFSK
jgi:myosin heavy subunit